MKRCVSFNQAKANQQWTSVPIHEEKTKSSMQSTGKWIKHDLDYQTLSVLQVPNAARTNLMEIQDPYTNRIHTQHTSLIQHALDLIITMARETLEISFNLRNSNPDIYINS